MPRIPCRAAPGAIVPSATSSASFSSLLTFSLAFGGKFCYIADESAGGQRRPHGRERYMFGFEYPKDMPLGRVCLELSLRPFGLDMTD